MTRHIYIILLAAITVLVPSALLTIIGAFREWHEAVITVFGSIAAICLLTIVIGVIGVGWLSVLAW